jgi:SAM-dependent methyltransferase
MPEQVDLYYSTYGNFASDVLREVRRETYGTDIGQNSWLTVDEFRQFFEMMALTQESNVLEVASGSGGPAVFMAQTVGCHVTGVDINEHGIANANNMATAQALNEQVRFQLVDASRPLPFDDETFDAIVCIDSINHFHGRSSVFAEWYRVLRSGGRVLFTDPIVVTGILSNDEIAIRSQIGYFLFVPFGENERLLKVAGFELLSSRDLTENEAVVSKRWHDARRDRRDELLTIEDQPTFEGLQRFLDIVHRLSKERRLSRIAFLARKP